MPLNIGNVLKAQEEGRWVKVPAASGDFALKLKPFLPGEQYALSEKITAAKGDLQGVGRETLAAVAAHILDWRDLLDADGSPIPYNAGLVKDNKFLDALMGLTMVGGGYLLAWIISKINKSDTFAEDTDTSFLANT